MKKKLLLLTLAIALFSSCAATSSHHYIPQNEDQTDDISDYSQLHSVFVVANSDTSGSGISINLINNKLRIPTFSKIEATGDHALCIIIFSSKDLPKIKDILNYQKGMSLKWYLYQKNVAPQIVQEVTDTEFENLLHGVCFLNQDTINQIKTKPQDYTLHFAAADENGKGYHIEFSFKDGL